MWGSSTATGVSESEVFQVVETAIVASHCFCQGKLESSGGVPKCVGAYIFETCPLKFRNETGLKGVYLTKCC